MQQKEKPIKKLAKAMYVSTRTVSKRAYEWSYANALLLTEILAFFMWGLRFHAAKKIEQTKKQKAVVLRSAFKRHDFVLDGEKYSKKAVSCTTLGTRRFEAKQVINAIVLLDAGKDQNASFWHQELFQQELFGKGKPFDAEKFFHIHFEEQSMDMIDIHYRILKEKFQASHIKIVAATTKDTVQARLWRERYPEFVSCMHFF